jgi:hypothetical protein
MAADQTNCHDQFRHTHATAAGLEDAIAIVLDLLMGGKADMNEYFEVSLQALYKILLEIRANPHGYNQERPSGQRLVIRKRYYDENS